MDIHDLRAYTRQAFTELGASGVEALSEKLKPYMLKALQAEAVGGGGIGVYKSMVQALCQTAAAGRSPGGLLAHRLDDSAGLRELWEAKMPRKPSFSRRATDERREALVGLLKDMDLLDDMNALLKSPRALAARFLGFDCRDARGGEYRISPEDVRRRADEARSGFKAMRVTEEEAREEVGLYAPLEAKL